MVDLVTVHLKLLATAFGLVLGLMIGRALTRRVLELDFRGRECEARPDSVDRGQATLSGHFLGMPVDYVVFAGLRRVRSSNSCSSKSRAGGPASTRRRGAFAMLRKLAQSGGTSTACPTRPSMIEPVGFAARSFG